MDRNGADVLTHLVARVDALATAQAVTARALETTWRPRLLALERKVDVLLELLQAGATAAAELGRGEPEPRRAIERAREDVGDEHED